MGFMMILVKRRDALTDYPLEGNLNCIYRLGLVKQIARLWLTSTIVYCVIHPQKGKDSWTLTLKKNTGCSLHRQMKVTQRLLSSMFHQVGWQESNFLNWPFFFLSARRRGGVGVLIVRVKSKVYRCFQDVFLSVADYPL